MPQQIDPVPAMTTNPGAPSVAPYNAIFASVTTSISPISSGVSVSRMRSRSSLRRAPASPICAATRSPRRIFAEAQALSIASRTAAAAPAIPTRKGLDGPARPSPITTLIGVHDHGFGLGPTTVDTYNRVLRVQASSRREICCSSFSGHSWGSIRLENSSINIIDYSRGR